MGGVLITPSGSMEHFGLVIPSGLVRRWACEGRMKSGHVIGQAELLPILVAYYVWELELRDQKVLVFVDNNAARHGQVGLRSGSLASLPIIGAIALQAGCIGLHPWYERVPGPCNIADGPSRLQFSAVEALGSKRVQVEAAETGLQLNGTQHSWPELTEHLQAR